MPIALWSHSKGGLYIDTSDSTFFTDASRHLTTISSKEIGGNLLSLIDKRAKGIGTKLKGGRVVIKLGHASLSSAVDETDANPDNFDPIFRSGKKIPGTSIQVAGVGSASTARYNPNAGAQYTKELGLSTPAFIALAHELCHCYHFMNGDLRENADQNTMLMIEEARTVGAGVFAGQRISENAIRKEWNLPLRTYYDTAGDCDNVPSVM